MGHVKRSNQLKQENINLLYTLMVSAESLTIANESHPAESVITDLCSNAREHGLTLQCLRLDVIAKQYVAVVCDAFAGMNPSYEQVVRYCLFYSVLVYYVTVESLRADAGRVKKNTYLRTGSGRIAWRTC